MKYKYLLFLLPVLLLIVLVSFFVFSARAEAQASRLPMPTSTPVPSDRREVVVDFIDEDHNTDTEIRDEVARVKYREYKRDRNKQQIDLAIRARLQEIPELVNNDRHPFFTDSITNDQSNFWGVVTSYPKSYSREDHALIPNILVIAGTKDNRNNWNVVIEGLDENYNQAINQLPDTLLSADSKLHLTTGTEAVNQSSVQAASTTYNIPGLPWAMGDSWVLSGGIHSSNNCCLDFSPPSGVNQVALAAADGTNIMKSGTCVWYKNGSIRLFYQHLDPSDVANAPTNISKGGYIGKLYTGTGCGWNTPVSKHVHFGTWDSTGSTGVSIVGSSLNGWIVNHNTQQNVTTLKKGNTTVGVNGLVKHEGSTGSCFPPSSGNWVITSNCFLNVSKLVPQDLIIENGNSLTLDGNMTLDMNLSLYKIIIKSDAKLVIKNDAKII